MKEGYRMKPEFTRVLIAVMVLIVSGQAFGQMGISPPYHDVQLDAGTRSFAFQVQNFSDRERTFDVSASNWTMDENNTVVELPPEKDSLDRWLIVNPTRFTLEPGQVQVVRFAASPAIRLSEGEHRAMLWFDEVLSEEDINIRRVRARMRYGAAIYGHIGDVTRTAEIEEVTFSGDRVEVTLTNTGNANIRFRGQYAIWKADSLGNRPAETEIANASGEVRADWPAGIRWADRMPQTVVLPGHTRTLSFPVGEGDILPPGDYVLNLSGRLGDRTLANNWPFRVVE